MPPSDWLTPTSFEELNITYHVDFGAKAGSYVDAFMSNLSWTAAEAAFNKIEA